MDDGFLSSQSALSDVPPGVAALEAFVALLPAVPSNWEILPLEYALVRGDHRPAMTHTLKHKTCGAVWNTDNPQMPEYCVCYKCGRK